MRVLCERPYYHPFTDSLNQTGECAMQYKYMLDRFLSSTQKRPNHIYPRPVFNYRYGEKPSNEHRRALGLDSRYLRKSKIQSPTAAENFGKYDH